MKRRTFGFAVVLAALVVLPAQAADMRVTIVEHGLYKIDAKSERLAPDGIVESMIENLCHYATTTTVPLKAGQHFGFRFRVDGLKAGEVVNLSKVIRFPTEAKPPDGPKPISAFRRAVSAQADKLYYVGYGLDYDWELMPGPWTFSIYRSDRKLAEIGFVAVAGAEAPMPSEEESTCFKLSSL
jgi:hypothetical protein